MTFTPHYDTSFIGHARIHELKMKRDAAQTWDSVAWFLTRECAHAHERVIAIMVFSLGRSVAWLVRLLTFGHAQ